MGGGGVRCQIIVTEFEKWGGSLSDICDRGAGGAKQTTNLLIE
jgi:hypothetical protein